MKKVIFSLVLLLITPLVIMADSYSSLWKQYEEVQKKNQPRSAISILNQISAKARAQKAYGQLIKAELEQVVNWQDLSADSLPSITVCWEKFIRRNSDMLLTPWR